MQAPWALKQLVLDVLQQSMGTLSDEGYAIFGPFDVSSGLTILVPAPELIPPGSVEASCCVGEVGLDARLEPPLLLLKALFVTLVPETFVPAPVEIDAILLYALCRLPEEWDPPLDDVTEPPPVDVLIAEFTTDPEFDAS